MPGFESLEYQILWVDFLSDFWEIMDPFSLATRRFAMVHLSLPSMILLTLSDCVVVPALSRRTGGPCRAVQTRWLVVGIDDQVRLVGCLDRKGRMFRTAVRDNVRLKARSIANARELTRGEAIVRAIDAAAEANFDMAVPEALFDYRSLRLPDWVENYGAWPTANGYIVARLATTHGMLVSSHLSAQAAFPGSRAAVGERRFCAELIQRHPFVRKFRRDHPRRRLPRRPGHALRATEWRRLA
ncbi:MAG: hypothetical protein Q8O35_13810 [Humidesulfovibrio sp.]|uniref:hypothetical protein n=1 Tax=Humidesulfovibrio sp. TaxID=2910988 RepID=UPI002732815B|nr:hypothetical protein [Humidesulfovibrio sp.]MDP2849244.1 hypothetical protein [Humidesulfovibrio sp.]